MASSKRVLLTGATGFVGAGLARRLLGDGHEVHLLVRPDHNPARIEAIAREVRLHECDLNDREHLQGVLASAAPDWVFHLAAHGAYSWQTDAGQILQTNFSGTSNLLDASLKVGFEAFVNTGSSSEYGWKDHAPGEDELAEPNSDYALGKAYATMFCRFAAAKHRLHIPTLRLYSVYGPWEDPKRLIPCLIAKGLQGEFPPLANPDIARDYVFAEDVNDAFIGAATTPTKEWGAIYNVGTGVQTTLRQIVETARRVMKIEQQPQWSTMPNRSWDTDIWVANPAKIKRELGWSPRYDLEQGLRATVEWFASQTG